MGERHRVFDRRWNWGGVVDWRIQREVGSQGAIVVEDTSLDRILPAEVNSCSPINTLMEASKHHPICNVGRQFLQLQKWLSPGENLKSLGYKACLMGKHWKYTFDGLFPHMVGDFF